MNKSQNTKRTIREHIINLSGALMIVLTPIIMVEIGLRIFDPWGIAYFDDIVKMSREFTYDEDRIYILPDGIYSYSHWSATIDNNVRVHTVDTSTSSCRIVLLGDSVTFGYGVNDEATWANQLAMQFPEIELLNTGVTQYSSENVLGTYKLFDDADAYLYLIISNDWQESTDWRRGVLSNPANKMPRFINYIKYYLSRDNFEADTPFGSASNNQVYDRFFNDIDALAQADNMAFLVFEDSPITDIMQNENYSVNILPSYPVEHRISFIDIHLNEQGNILLAEMIAPILETNIEEHCN